MTTSNQEQAFYILKFARTHAIVIVQQILRNLIQKGSSFRNFVAPSVKHFATAGCFGAKKDLGRLQTPEKAKESIAAKYVYSICSARNRCKLKLDNTTGWCMQFALFCYYFLHYFVKLTIFCTILYEPPCI